MKENFVLKNDSMFAFSTVNRAQIEDSSLKGFMTNRDWKIQHIEKNDTIRKSNPFIQLPEVPSKSFNYLKPQKD